MKRNDLRSHCVEKREGVEQLTGLEGQSPGALLWAAGLTWENLAQVCGVSARTVTRWRRRGELPPLLRLALAPFVDLGALSPAWSGWQIAHRTGELYSPENQTFTPGELRSWQFRYQQIRALQRRVRELERELEERPARVPWIPARARRSTQKARRQDM